MADLAAAEPLLPGPRGCTCFRLRRTTRRMTRIYDAHLAPCGLTLTQYSLLTALVRLPGPSLHELAEAIGMDRTSLTRTLQPMIDRGLVAFAPGLDRRSKRVEATAAGRALRAEAKRLWLEAEREVRERLGPDEVSELHHLLDRSFERLEGVG